MAVQSKVRQELLERLTTAFDHGELPWSRGWLRDRPQNPTTGKEYRGVNALYLSVIAMDKGYTDNRWCTFNQAKEQGWHIRKGETASHVEYWACYDKFQKKLLDWSEVRALTRKDPEYEKNLSLRCKTYAVFNGSQMDGIPAPEERTSVTEPELLAKRDRLLRNMGVGFREYGDQAYYSPGTDTITMPPENQFFSGYCYMATLLHEAGHATGHESRLNRQISNAFGDVGYAKEELRAEIASAMAVQELGIPGSMSEEHIRNHAAYLQSWSRILRDEPNELFRAINDAQEIADHLIEKGQLLEPVEVKNMKKEIESAVPQERREELERAWNECDKWDEEDYLAWYEDLTADERMLVDQWDRQYEQGVLKISGDIQKAQTPEAVENMTVVMVRPGEEAQITQIPNTLEQMQTAVGGDIEAVYPFDDPVVLICNEEGKNLGLPLNRGLHGSDGRLYDILVGDFFVAGLKADNFGSLAPELAQKYQQHFKSPEQFFKLGGEIVSFKAGPEELKDALNAYITKNTPEAPAQAMTGPKLSMGD